MFTWILAHTCVVYTAIKKSYFFNRGFFLKMKTSIISKNVQTNILVIFRVGISSRYWSLLTISKFLFEGSRGGRVGWETWLMILYFVKVKLSEKQFSYSKSYRKKNFNTISVGFFQRDGSKNINRKKKPAVWDIVIIFFASHSPMKCHF